MKTIRVMLALVGVVISFTAALTITGAQRSSGGNSLSGTSWQLVKFQGPDERTFTPDDKSKYTIRFGRDGRVAVRVDCNRGNSTWRITPKGELQFGSWSRTNAKCGPGSLHDQIVTEGATVRNFTIKDGHLFLSGMAGGGYYELEPMPEARR
jgi:heat shock protein HslJ